MQYTEGRKRRRPTRRIPWLGFEVDTYCCVVQPEERKIHKGLGLREELFEASSGSELSARALPATLFFLSFLRFAAPGGFCYLRSGWDAANDSGAMDQWKSGIKGTNAQPVAENVSGPAV